MSIARLFLELARRWPRSPALVEDDSSRTLSFTQLACAAYAQAGALAAHAITPGDRVALLGDNDIEYLVADYGAMCGGYVRVPLDPSLTTEELAAQVADAEARILLCGEAHRASAEKIAAMLAARGIALAVVGLDKGLADAAIARGQHAPALPTHGEVDPSSLASLNYTGGSSGAPKAVMLSHANLRAIVQNVVLARGMGAGDVMVNMRPLWPIAAVIVLAHLASGGTVVLGGRFEARRLVALLARYRAAATTMVPTHLVRVVRDCTAEELGALSSLRSIDIGAAAVPPDVLEQALAAFGPKIGILYGLTEASWSCYQPPAMLDVAGDQRIRRMRSVGRPVLGCDVRIESEAGEAAPGEAGEILIRGANVMRGYWKRAELTAGVLRDGWFHTGDLGVLDADGVLSVVGRLKNVIRSGGKSVDPTEVEDVLSAIPGIAEAAVLGLPDTEWGEVVVAAIVPSPGVTLDESTVSDRCASALSPHKRPKLIVQVGELPRSHYGKVQLGKLKAQIAARLGRRS